MPVRRRGNRNGRTAVYTEHAQNNAHFDGPTTIGLGVRNFTQNFNEIEFIKI